MSKADSLEEVKKVLKTFSSGLAMREDAWQKLLKDNSDFPQLSEAHWKETLGQCWTFGTTEMVLNVERQSKLSWLHFPHSNAGKNIVALHKLAYLFWKCGK